MKFVYPLIACAALSYSGVAASQGAMPAGINPFLCGPITNAFGPYDYRKVPSETRHKVEDWHFTPEVEQLRSGKSGYIGSDIDYTLRAFPNNPRALVSVARYVNVKHTTQLQGATYPAECYFERAIRFQPNDPMPRLIYAMYLKDRGRKGEAKQQLDVAEQMRGDQSNFDFDYNLGLLYFEVGDYDKSAAAAKRAYALGAPLPALAGKLKAKGRPVDMLPPAAAPSAAPAPVAPSATVPVPAVTATASAPPFAPSADATTPPGAPATNAAP